MPVSVPKNNDRSRNRDEIRKRIEKDIKDPAQKELLLKLIDSYPDLENQLLNVYNRNIDSSELYKSGSPSTRASSPVVQRRLRTPSFLMRQGKDTQKIPKTYPQII